MKGYLEKVDYSIPENKHKMNDLFYMAVCSVKENDEELYNHIKCEMYEIVYGKKISDDMADDWVKSMQPMPKWTRADITNVATGYSLSIPLNCAYVIMNMLYSDSKNVYGDGETEESIDKYVQGTKDWFYDSDAIDGEEKLYNYWKYIVKRD